MTETVDWSGTPAAGSEGLLALALDRYTFGITTPGLPATTYVGFTHHGVEMLARCNGESHTDVGDYTVLYRWSGPALSWIPLSSAEIRASDWTRESTYAAISWAELSAPPPHITSASLHAIKRVDPASLRLVAEGHPLEWVRAHGESQE